MIKTLWRHVSSFETKLSRSVVVLGSYGPSLINFRGPLIAAMVRAGWQVTAAAPDIDATTEVRLRALGAVPACVPLARTGMNPCADLSYYGALKRLFREVQPDALIAYTVKPVIWGTLAAHAAGTPNIIAMITGLGYAFTDAAGSPLKRRIARTAASLLYRRALAHAHTVIFQNPDDRDLFWARGLLKKAAKAIISNGSGIDLGHYARAPLPNRNAFLMIARLLGAKGVREYAAACIALKRKYPHAAFRLAGWMDEGPDSIAGSELQNWTAQGLEYLGRLDDVRPALAAADVYVLPSFYREGTPRTVLEALAMGRPVVTTDAPGCRETVKHGVNGFLVPPRDVIALAAAMERLILEPQLAELMGEQSWYLACQKYDVRIVNDQILAVLDCEAAIPPADRAGDHEAPV